MASCTAECGPDDLPKLENNVVYALSRLGQTNTKSSGNRGKVPGVSTQQIVEFLTENYQDLDGDIESQVITALLSCVKIGFVCAQDNGKFRFLGANPRLMTSNCLTRFDHGTKCSCIALMNSMTKIKPHNCCVLQAKSKKSPSPKTVLKRTPANAMKSGKKGQMKLPQRVASECHSSSPCPAKKAKKKNPTTKCIQGVSKQLLESEPGVAEGTADAPRYRKCSYCLRNHVKGNGDKKTCNKCYPTGMNFTVPPDKFSPREEVMCDV